MAWDELGSRGEERPSPSPLVKSFVLLGVRGAAGRFDLRICGVDCEKSILCIVERIRNEEDETQLEWQSTTKSRMYVKEREYILLMGRQQPHPRRLRCRAWS